MSISQLHVPYSQVVSIVGHAATKIKLIYRMLLSGMSLYKAISLSNYSFSWAICVSINTNCFESPDAINLKEASNIERILFFTGDRGFHGHEPVYGYF